MEQVRRWQVLGEGVGSSPQRQEGCTTKAVGTGTEKGH